MSLPSPPICTWRPGDGEALRIALFISVTPAALAALNREMAQLQTHYLTRVCTAKGHLDAIADLDQQLAALTPRVGEQPWQGLAGSFGVCFQAAPRGYREPVGPSGPKTAVGSPGNRIDSTHYQIDTG
jgi:hypothetical protein